MVNYKNSKIYKIVNDENDNFYIGSSTRPLHKRMWEHRNNHHLCMSKNIGVDLKQCSIILVEELECENKEQLLRKEREYIDKYKKEGLNIVNKARPIITEEEKKEYHKEKYKRYKKNKEYMEKKRKKNKEYNNKEIIKEYKKEYAENNKEKIKEYKKEWYKKNKETHILKSKENRQKNKEEITRKSKIKITCECGSIVCKVGLLKHKKTKKHINLISSQ